MKRITLQVSEELHRSLKEVARRKGRPVAELAREAMADFVERAQAGTHSLLDLRPLDCGVILEPWNDEEIHDRFLGRE